MAERNYKAPEFGVRDTRGISQRGPSVGRTTGGGGHTVVAGDSTWQDRLLGNVLGQAQQIAMVAFQNQEREAYIAGQTAQLLGKSVEELEGDPLTQDWQRAGYQDNATKVALAEAQANFMADLPELARGTPEELQSYLAKRRRDLVPTLQGMTKSAQAQAFDAILSLDAQSVNAYTPARAKYIVGERTAAASTSVRTALSGLSAIAAQVQTGETSLESYQSTVQGAGKTILGNTLGDESLPTNVRQQLFAQAIDLSMADGLTNLYEFFRDSVDGESRSILGELPMRDQVKLAEKYSKLRTKQVTDAQLTAHTDVAMLRASIANSTFEGSPQDVFTRTREWVANGILTPAQAGTLVAQAANMKGQSEEDSTLVTALNAGQYHIIDALGKTPAQAVKAFTKQLALNNADDTTIEQSLRILGQREPAALTEYSKRVGRNFHQVRAGIDGDIPNDAIESVLGIVDTYSELKRDGNYNGAAAVLTGLSEEDRITVARINDLVSTGIARPDAVRTAVMEDRVNAARTPSEKAGMSSMYKSLSLTDIAESTSAASTLTQWMTTAKGLLPLTDTAFSELRPKAGVLSQGRADIDSAALLQAEHDFRTEYLKEANRLEATQPYLAGNKEVLMQTVEAALVDRAIVTDSGVVFIPQGSSLLSKFNLPTEAKRDLGIAISILTRPTRQDSRVRVRFDDDGRLVAQELIVKTGQPVGTPYYVSDADIKSTVKSLIDRGAAKAGEPFKGTTYKGKTGVPVTFNGENSVGVPADWQFNLRKDLIKYEDVRDTIYPDAANPEIMTGGVGVASTNTYWQAHLKGRKHGDVLTQAEINESFAAASNEAGAAARRVMSEAGLYGKETYRFLAHVAYQAGTGALQSKSTYKELVNSMKEGDDVKALTALSKTGVFQYGKDRATFYREQLIRANIEHRRGSGRDAYSRAIQDSAL